jgi:chaperonin GroES
VKLVPLGGSVVVKPLSGENSASGLVLPEVYHSRVCEGRVLSVGDGRLLPDGSRALPQVAEGDRVLFEEYAGISVEINGEKFLVLNENDILAIVG